MDEIKEYLTTSTSYDQGVNLLKKYSRNRAMIMALSRRENSAKLRYELSKLLPMPLVIRGKESLVAVDLGKDPKRKIIYAELPDQLKPIYDKAAQAYHNARKHHYAMKSAKSDAARSAARKAILEYVGENKACWGILNGWLATGELPKAQEESKSLSSLATSLTRTLEKLDKETSPGSIEELKAKCAQLVSSLTSAGRILSQKTIDRLTTHNIDV